MTIKFDFKGGDFPIRGSINNWIRTYNGVNNCRLLTFIRGYDNSRGIENLRLSCRIPDFNEYDIVLVSAYIYDSPPASPTPYYPTLKAVKRITDGYSFATSYTEFDSDLLFQYDSTIIDGIVGEGEAVFWGRRYALNEVLTPLTELDVQLTYFPMTSGVNDVDPRATEFYGMYVFLVKKTQTTLDEMVDLNDFTAARYNTLLNFLKDDIFSIPLSVYSSDVLDAFALARNIRPDIGIKSYSANSFTAAYNRAFQYSATPEVFTESLIFSQIDPSIAQNVALDFLDKLSFFNYMRGADYKVDILPELVLLNPSWYPWTDPVSSANYTPIISKSNPGRFFDIYVEQESLTDRGRTPGDIYYVRSEWHIVYRFLKDAENQGYTYFTKGVGDAPNIMALQEMNRAYSYMKNNRHSFMYIANTRTNIRNLMIYPNKRYLDFDPDIDRTTTIDIGSGALLTFSI